jgi:ABC-type antimicrobial peptide transport system permease subunit
MTLGADAGGILSLILTQGMRPVMWGVIIGFAACAAASRFMSVVLYGVSPFDPLTFGGVALFLTCVAMLACYVPARRATKVDPMAALRYE